METVKAMKLLTLDEVAEMLRKSPAQLRWMRHNGTGPRSARLGGRVMFREQDVVNWVNAAFEDAEATA
jgi:predicted DNA-binding transcriptional regulator AlpA